MKLKYEFISNEITDKTIAFTIGEGSKNYHSLLKMNHTGASIFSKLQTDISEDELIAQMKKEYPDETDDTVREVVTDFVNKLKNEGLITD